MKFKSREESEHWMMFAVAAIMGQRPEEAPSIADRTMEAMRERRSELDERDRARYQRPERENLTAEQVPAAETT